jgi:hypothetical protein
LTAEAAQQKHDKNDHEKCTNRHSNLQSGMECRPKGRSK